MINLSKINVRVLRASVIYGLINISYVINTPCNREVIVIDPAGSLTQWDKFFECNELIPEILLLTHGHNDHSELAPKISQKYGIPFVVNENDLCYLTKTCGTVELINGDTVINSTLGPINSFYTPGHSLGGVCYIIADNFFSGDTLFIEGCGYCNIPGGSAKDLYNSLEKIKNFVTPELKVYPGHEFLVKPGVSFSYLENTNIYLSAINSDAIEKFSNQASKLNYKQYKGIVSSLS